MRCLFLVLLYVACTELPEQGPMAQADACCEATHAEPHLLDQGLPPSAGWMALDGDAVVQGDIIIGNADGR